jgi:hypothetical protein
MKFEAALLFILSMTTSAFVMSHSWRGIRYVAVGHGRSPAAVHGIKDLSSLRGASFVDQNDVVQTDDGLEVHLSQFVMRDEQGLRNFVCRVEGRSGVFNRVELTLVGVGISEAGRTPTLRVQADCLSQPNPREIGAIVVPLPLAEIYRMKPRDQEFQLSDAFESSVRVSQMVSEWPREWRLQSIRYFDSENPAHELALTPQSESSPEGALTLNWNGPSGRF